MAANSRTEGRWPQIKRRGRVRRARLVLASFLMLIALSWFMVQMAGRPAGTTLAAPLDGATPTLVPGTGAVAGVCWQDLNENGILDPGEPGLPGMTLTIVNQDQSVKLTTTAGADGSYRFEVLEPALYTLTAVPPTGYELTTPASFPIFISSGTILLLNFGARFVPTPTPTPTPTSTPTLEPTIDIDHAAFAICGGVIRANTQDGQSNVSRYGCRPAWSESGPELVYRVELGRPQPLSASIITATADLDLFLLTSASPASCVASGDTAFTYNVQPGVYFLVVDGYNGAAGSFDLKLSCPLEPYQATATPTFTPSPTPTASATFTPSVTPTVTPTGTPRKLYLPLALRSLPTVTPTVTPAPVSLAFQQGVNDYAGASDTTLSFWRPTAVFGDQQLLDIFNAEPPQSIRPQKEPALRFDLSMLPSAANIVTAALDLYVPTAPDRDLRAEAHALLRSWDEMTATWEQPASGQVWAEAGAQGAGADYSEFVADTQHILPAGQVWYTFDVTSLVREWVRDPASNFGLILRTQSGDDPSNVGASFASREYPTPALRPRLRFSYWITPETVTSSG